MKGVRKEKVNLFQSGGLHRATSGAALWEYDYPVCSDYMCVTVCVGGIISHMRIEQKRDCSTLFNPSLQAKFWWE